MEFDRRSKTAGIERPIVWIEAHIPLEVRRDDQVDLED